MPPKGAAHLWLPASPSKRWAEIFYLAYSPFWITWTLCILVPFKLYERCDSLAYLAIGLSTALPCVLLPLWLQPKSDRGKPWSQRYWVKANLWIAIFSFIGNYFWTHYFYELLGAAYTFPSWRLNDVPITLYFMTHAYFLFYHTISNMSIRRVKSALRSRSPLVQQAAVGLTVFLLAYFTAVMETVTIAHFPYYTFKDKSRMYTVGSLFYAIYFFVSFPVFFQMDERPQSKWTLGRAATDALASGMAVTILLDLWRLTIGGITSPIRTLGLPWM